MSADLVANASLPDLGIACERRRGRGATSNITGRFERETRELVDDGWDSVADLPAFQTHVREEMARSIISRNDSPDISFDQSINPYRGCEHGCIYCYARPSHTYLGHSAGLDFESQLYAKANAAERLRVELAAKHYVPKTIALGANTDPYQPIDRRFAITRDLLEVMDETSHPVGIVTKSIGVLRDLDILERLAARGLVKVALSITTLDRKLARIMEPRASTPAKRLEAVEKLTAAGIPTAVMTAPLIPALNDHEVEALLQAAAEHGASEAGYVLLRLPLEIKDLFAAWLEAHLPDKASHVMNLLTSMHAGRAYRAAFGLRQTGRGPYADQLAQRFKLALRRNGLNRRRLRLRTDLFVPPPQPGDQMRLI